MTEYDPDWTPVLGKPENRAYIERTTREQGKPFTLDDPLAIARLQQMLARVSEQKKAS